jgi:hypothetical protein
VKLTIHFHLVPKSKNECGYTSTPQYAFMVWCLVKHRDNLTFTLWEEGDDAWGEGDVFTGFWLGRPRVGNRWEDLG